FLELLTARHAANPAGLAELLRASRNEFLTGVTRVTRVTERSHPRVFAALDANAGITRVAEPQVTRVTAPSRSAVEVTQVPQHSTPRLPRKAIDDQCSNPDNPSNPGNEEYLTSLNIAAGLAWWGDFFEERVSVREIDGGRPREEAEGLAFGDTILEWHHRYGARLGSRRFAGCGDELAWEGGLVLSHGAPVPLEWRRSAK